jgi:copper(I)-binding protein
MTRRIVPGEYPMRRAAFALFAALAVTACQQEAPHMLAVSDAWVRLPAIPGNPAAAYFTLHGGPEADSLVAVESPKVQRIELHESKTVDGKTTMAALGAVAVPAGATVTFAPAGSHAMLFGVDPAIQPNGTLPLTLRFASGKTLAADAHTVSAGGSAPEHDDH